MNSFKMQIGFVLVTTYLTAGCISTTNTSSKNDTTTIVVTKITKDGKLPPGEWHIYNLPHETICIPEKWRFVDQNEFLFMASLNQIDSNSYFQVIKERSEEEGGMTYLKRLYSYLKKGLNGNFNTYSAISTIYDDKMVFNCEFHVIIANQKYVIYSTVFEKDAYLFEIRLVFPEKSIGAFQQAYNNILYNFYINKKLAFDVNGKIKNGQVIDLGKL